MPTYHPLLTNPKPPYNRSIILDWLFRTNYVTALVHKHTSPLDRRYVDDFEGEVWLQICLIPEAKLISLFENKGKFVNYIKSLIKNNVKSVTSPTYKNTKSLCDKEYMLDEEQWGRLLNDGKSNCTVTFPELRTKDNGRYVCETGYDTEDIILKNDLQYEIENEKWEECSDQNNQRNSNTYKELQEIIARYDGHKPSK